MTCSSCHFARLLGELCGQLVESDMCGSPLPSDFAVGDNVWRALPQYAHQQGVAALVFDALRLLPAGVKPPREVFFALAGQADTIRQRSRQRASALADMERQTACHYAVLKGAFLASLWPSADSRPSADVDIWCGAATEDLARTIESHGIACDRSNPRHVTFCFHGVPFEAHRYLFFYEGDRRRYVDWEGGGEAAPGQLPSPLSAARQALFLAAHACYDALFFDVSITLRTCVDWTLLWRYLCCHPSEKQEYEQLLRGASFERFARAFTCYCTEVLFHEFASGVATQDCGERESGCNVRQFCGMFRSPRQRSRVAVVRVWRRCVKYVQYGACYRWLFGQNMFRAFYARNVARAALQQLRGRRKR